MKKFRVTITRTTSSTLEFEVLAENEEEADSKALEEAYNTVWSAKNSEYEVETIEEI